MPTKCLTMHYINGRLVDQQFNWLNLRWLYKTFFILYILPVIAINIIICLDPNYKSECNGAQFK